MMAPHLLRKIGLMSYSLQKSFANMQIAVSSGLPHYGHLLASTIKDIIPRYWSMKGYHVERRFGWDTHGIPIEHEIDKKLGISGKDAVMKLGLSKYNKECRAIVMRYSTEWRVTIERLGRWIDFDNDYKVNLISRNPGYG
jgi:isoleucyl-tRNA synthetase